MLTLIFDKSFVEGLSVDELSELFVFFEPVSTPILQREILADLEKGTNAKRDNLAVLKSLSEKMSRSGLDTMGYRKAACADLMHSVSVPFNGAIVIDPDAPHIRIRNGGIFIDGKQLQWDWRRWARGEFTDEERQIAQMHRKTLADWDPQAYCNQWRGLAKREFGDCRNLDALIDRIDELIADPRPLTQEMILEATLSCLSAPEFIRNHTRSLFKAGLIPNVQEYAPYAVSVTRITFVYQIALAKGIFGPRKSDVFDLEYLYYAPFCKLFVSEDRLHGSMWKATRTRAIFIKGSELKADLKRRAELRKTDPKRVGGPLPIPLDGSVITEAMNKLQEIDND